MKSKYTKKIASLALMSLFSASAFAAGVATSTEELEKTTITELNINTITYTDANGDKQTINLDSPLVSAYTLSKITDISTYTGNYITKYLDNGDGTYTAKYYEVEIASKSYTENAEATTLNYYWQADGTILEGSVDGAETSDLAFTVSYDGTILTPQIDGDSYDGNGIGNSSTSYGGAICNEYATTITGDFIGNSATVGGAICNKDTTTITGDFIGNSASNDGGAIYNYGTISAITGDFIGNSASDDGGAIYNYYGTISTITGDFIGNSAYYYGGAICNYGGTISTIAGDFIGNSASTSGGAIFNNKGTISTITGDFIGNSSNYGGAIYNNTGTISTITGDFIGNSSTSGGAIYNSGTITFLAQDDDVNFTGNYVGSSSYTSNAIYNYGYSSSDATVNFNAFDGNSIVVNDGISGLSTNAAYQILEINNATIIASATGYVTQSLIDDINNIGYKFTQDDLGKPYNHNNEVFDYEASSYSTVEFNNTVSYQTVNVYNGTLKLGSYAGGYVNEEYTAEPSTAKLSNSYLNVKDDATLNIATDVELTSSTITLESGSTLLFNAYSSLVLDSSSSITVADTAKIIIDLAGMTAENSSFDIMTFASAEDLLSFLAAIKIDMFDGFSVENIKNSALSVVSGDTALTYGTDYVLSTSNDGTTLSVSSVAPTAAVPEPSTYAMIIGILALGFAAYRRRK